MECFNNGNKLHPKTTFTSFLTTSNPSEARLSLQVKDGNMGLYPTSLTLHLRQRLTQWHQQQQPALHLLFFYSLQLATWAADSGDPKTTVLSLLFTSLTALARGLNLRSSPCCDKSMKHGWRCESKTLFCLSSLFSLQPSSSSHSLLARAEPVRGQKFWKIPFCYEKFMLFLHVVPKKFFSQWLTQGKFSSSTRLLVWMEVWFQERIEWWMGVQKVSKIYKWWTVGIVPINMMVFYFFLFFMPTSMLDWGPTCIGWSNDEEVDSWGD